MKINDGIEGVSVRYVEDLDLHVYLLLNEEFMLVGVRHITDIGRDKLDKKCTQVHI
jgi:hypothetical protein